MPINPSLLGAMECGIFWDYENIRVPRPPMPPRCPTRSDGIFSKICTQCFWYIWRCHLRRCRRLRAC
jgi:hypothetical protein